MRSGTRRRRGTQSGDFRAITCVLALFCALAAAGAQAHTGSGRGFLGPPSDGAPQEIAEAHLREHAAELGLGLADLDAALLVSRRHNARTGAEHLFFRQRIRGLDVIGADLGVSVDAEGRVFSRWSRAVADLARRAPPPVPAISAEDAAASAAAHFGLAAPPAATAPAQLAYRLRPAGGVALVYALVIDTRDGAFWGEVFVDASDGSVLETRSWTDYDSYRVFAMPLDDPEAGSRSLETDPADPTASPFGWHDTNGSPGAEYTDTRGNNVLAQEDVDGNDFGGTRPSSPTLDFDFPLDLEQQPAAYQSAAITNLFYWNNVAHDLFYHYGFDEAAGNFQENNYGNGGAASDAVVADAQDGWDTDNANFSTPPDGSNPRMQMFVWLAGGSEVEVLTPPAIAGPRTAGAALFGPGLDSAGLTGDVVAALDGAGSSTDVCSAVTNPGTVSGNIALVDRGSCDFTVKVKNCQDAGATGVIVANNAGNGTITMAGSDATITIPSLFIGQADGAEIRSNLGAGVSTTLRSEANRDADLDSGVVLHEYAHGMTNRMTGGPATVACLDTSQSGGMGEGWSDFFAIAFTSQPGDTGDTPRAIAAYLAKDPGGIRHYPYSTDLQVDPLTFGDIETLNVPHGVGEVWAIALWEAYWNYVAAFGHDPDPYAGDGGNNRIVHRVVDALSIQPCDPTFLAARDAIFQADLVATGGADACLLWDAFAKRGMGVDASDQSGAFIDVTESFDVPPECAEYCGDGELQSGEQCDDGNRLDFDGCHAVCLAESDFALSGIAQGGSVSLTIEGVEVGVDTSSGQSAEEVLLALAAAIEADPTLQAAGISARVENGVLTTGGVIGGESIEDAGFIETAPVPGLSPSSWIAVWVLMATASVHAWRRRAWRT